MRDKEEMECTCYVNQSQKGNIEEIPLPSPTLNYILINPLMVDDHLRVSFQIGKASLCVWKANNDQCLTLNSQHAHMVKQQNTLNSLKRGWSGIGGGLMVGYWL